jgi:hypothetical protein
VARKHLGWYWERAGRPDIRDSVLTQDDPAAVIRLVRAALTEPAPMAEVAA